jgi:hypothetical protein
MMNALREGSGMIRAIGPSPPSPFVEWDGTEEGRLQALAEDEEFRKNLTWFSTNAKRLRDEHSGQYICIANQELFVGDDSIEVFNRAKAAHPNLVGGFFCKRLSRHRGPKIYANRRLLG